MTTAQASGELWSHGARDWASFVEPQYQLLYKTVHDRLAMGNGTRLLDVGCGPGGAALLANAVQNMQSYEQIAEAHAQHLQKLVPAFDNLYNAMPEQQKKLTDQVFRANAEQHAAQSRHGATETAK